jgi:hypothetical protein
MFQLLLFYCVLGREIGSRNGYTGCLEEILTVVAEMVVSYPTAQMKGIFQVGGDSE